MKAREIEQRLANRESPTPPDGLLDKIRSEIPRDLRSGQNIDRSIDRPDRSVERFRREGTRRPLRLRELTLAASVMVLALAGLLAVRLDRVRGGGDSGAAAPASVANPQGAPSTDTRAESSRVSSPLPELLRGSVGPSEAPSVERTQPRDQAPRSDAVQGAELSSEGVARAPGSLTAESSTDSPQELRRRQREELPEGLSEQVETTPEPGLAAPLDSLARTRDEDVAGTGSTGTGSTGTGPATLAAGSPEGAASGASARNQIAVSPLAASPPSGFADRRLEVETPKPESKSEDSRPQDKRTQAQRTENRLRQPVRRFEEPAQQAPEEARLEGAQPMRARASSPTSETMAETFATAELEERERQKKAPATLQVGEVVLTWVEGGLEARGQVAPGSRVTLDQDEVEVAEDGSFRVLLQRAEWPASGELELRVVAADGKRQPLRRLGLPEREPR